MKLPVELKALRWEKVESKSKHGKRRSWYRIAEARNLHTEDQMGFFFLSDKKMFGGGGWAFNRSHFDEDFLSPNDTNKEHWKKMEKALRFGSNL